MDSPTTYSGRLLRLDDAPEGWITVAEGCIVDRGEGAPDDRDARPIGWIMPRMVNAHTHVGDAALREIPGRPGTVSELFGPGGWKHQHLERLEPEAMAEGIKRYTREMAAIGVARFIDFREGGLPGSRFLQQLAPELPSRPVVLGRPARNDFREEEASDLLAHVDGIGLSGMRDFPDPQDLEAWAEACHAARKPFAVHVSENRRDDMDAVLALDPTFLVHMTLATRSDLQAAADEGAPIVVCPRSNAHFGRKVPIKQMLDAGCTVAVGTDNGMLQDGDLLKELALLRTGYPDVAPETLLRMASHHGHRLLGEEEDAERDPGLARDTTALLHLPTDAIRARQGTDDVRPLLRPEPAPDPEAA